MAVDARALVVDDNEINLMVGGELLRSYGLRVDEVESGALALQACRDKKYDVIFMDHMMPEMDGVEATKRIRGGESQNRGTPIIALTANAVLGMREVFLGCGMNDFISKPIDTEELERVLRTWLPGDKLRQSRVGTELLGSESNSFLEGAMEQLGIYFKDAIRLVGGNESAYLLILDAFTKNLKTQMEALYTLAQASDMAGFAIQVHGLKSALANVGAKDLSLLARNLEMAAKDEKKNYLQEHLPGFFQQLEVLEKKLELFFTEERKGHAQEATRKAHPEGMEYLRRKIPEIKEALEILDNDAAMLILDELMACAFSPQQDKILEQLRDAVELFDYDTAMGLLPQLLP